MTKRKTRGHTKSPNMKKENNVSYTDKKMNAIMKQVGSSDENGNQISLRQIALKYNINYNTMKFRYNKYRSGVALQSHGGNNKIFTEQQERELYDCIRIFFIGNNLYFDDFF